MENFPTLQQKNYNALRHEIRSGDLLLCSGNFVFSNLIQKATQSVWSHVAFILRLDQIDRIMLLESVESIGVRTVPLSSYVNDYNGTGKPYPGRLMLARHDDIKQKNIPKLSRTAIDLLGYPYHSEEIAHIASRISLHTLGLPNQQRDAPTQKTFICSEYVYTCFQSIEAAVDYNPVGFISPADFANSSKVKPLCYIDTSNTKEKAA